MGEVPGEVIVLEVDTEDHPVDMEVHPMVVEDQAMDLDKESALEAWTMDLEDHLVGMEGKEDFQVDSPATEDNLVLEDNPAMMVSLEMVVNLEIWVNLEMVVN